VKRNFVKNKIHENVLSIFKNYVVFIFNYFYKTSKFAFLILNLVITSNLYVIYKIQRINIKCEDSQTNFDVILMDGFIELSLSHCNSSLAILKLV